MKMNANRLLVVDDDAVTRDLLREVFEQEGFEVTLAASGEEALQCLGKSGFPLVLSDIRMLGLDGIELLGKVRAIHPETFVILMTGFGNLEGAVRAIQEGAYDYISKPFRIQELKALVARAQKQWKQLREAGAPAATEPPQFEKRTLIGHSPMIVDVYKNLARAALSNSSVLINGESGTGKELVARALHRQSARAAGPFVAVNCAALTEHLLESELFGHEKGAFTGAVAQKKGKLELAQGGTVFLDEVGELAPSLQAKFLRVLQEHEFDRVGGTRTLRLDVRLIAATNRDLEAATDRGAFRPDLFYRLNVVNLRLPPLRDRREDIPRLAAHFLDRISRDRGAKFILSDEALRTMMQFHWPGNVRELENSVERACTFASGPVLRLGDMPTQLQQQGLEAHSVSAGQGGRNGAEPNGVKTLADLERDAILSAIRVLNGDKLRAAKLLGIGKTTLYRKLKEYGISDSPGGN